MADETRKRSRPSFEEAWRQRFIKFSENDDDAGIAGWSPTGLEARFRHFRRIWAAGNEGTLWLDVGCGAGTYGRFLAANSVEVIGMDYSYPTLVKARARADHQCLWVVADLTKLPVATGTADGALCFGVMQALERSEPAIEELVRAVKPGGQIWIDALNSWCLPSLWARMVRRARGRPIHLRYESPRRLKRLMARMDCTAIQAYWIPILPSSMQGYQRVLESRIARWLLDYVPLVGLMLSHAFVLKGRRTTANPEATDGG